MYQIINSAKVAMCDETNQVAILVGDKAYPCGGSGGGNGNGGGALVVHMSNNGDRVNEYGGYDFLDPTIDKTFEEILEAYNSGVPVMIYLDRYGTVVLNLSGYQYGGFIFNAVYPEYDYRNNMIHSFYRTITVIINSYSVLGTDRVLAKVVGQAN